MRVIGSDYFLEPLRRSKLIARPIPVLGPNSSRLSRTENSTSNPIYLQPEVNYLTKAEKLDLIKNRIEPARLKYKQARSQAERYKIIQDYFEASVGKPEYLVHPVFQQFVKDSQKGDYYQTRSLLSKLKPNFVIGVFQTPWSPELKTESLEGMTFDEEDYGLKKDYPSNAIAVKNVLLSRGFTNEIFVALFPENFVVKNDDLRRGSDFDAYYIVDNFVNRYHKYTKKIIESHAPEVFPSLRNITQEDLQYAIATWLSAHEHFHTTGPIPRVYRPNSDEEQLRVNKNKNYGFDLKDTKEGGAFEEMRVDLNTLVRLGTASMQADSKGKATLIRDFILAERLLRYIAQKNPYDHFDSTVQLVLVNHLVKEGVLTIDDKNQIKLGEFTKVTNSLASLLNQVNELEAKISQEKDLSIPKDFDEAEEMICKFMRDRARPLGSSKPEDLEFLENYSSIKAKYTHEMRLAKKEDDSEKQKKLRKDFAGSLKLYFERFYPLQPFHQALRDTLKPYLPREKKTPRSSISQLQKKNSEPLTIATLHRAKSNSSKSVKATEIIIKSSRTDLKDIQNLPRDADRAGYDKAFVEILRQDTGSAGFDPKTVEGTLKTVALQSPGKFVNGIKTQRLLLLAHLDVENRLDADAVQNYNQLIFDLYQEQLSKLGNSTDQEKFISNLKRILRHMLRETQDKDALTTSLKSWQNELKEIQDHQKTSKERRKIGIVAAFGLLTLSGIMVFREHSSAIESQNEEIKRQDEEIKQHEVETQLAQLKNEITKKRSISDSGFKGINAQDLEGVYKNILEGPAISRIIMSQLKINKNRLAECEIKPDEKELIKPTLKRDGKKVQISCSLTAGDILRIEDQGTAIHVILPKKFIPILMNIADDQLEKTLLEMKKNKQYKLEISPRLLPIRDPGFNMSRTHIWEKASSFEEWNHNKIISSITIAILQLALEQHPDRLKGKIVDDKSFVVNGKEKTVQFSVQYAPPGSDLKVIITEDPVSGDKVVIMPGKVPALAVKHFDQSISQKTDNAEIFFDNKKLRDSLREILNREKITLEILK